MPENPNTWLAALREIGSAFGAWLAVPLAIIVRLLAQMTGPRGLSWSRACLTASSALLAAWVGTDPLCYLLG